MKLREILPNCSWLVVAALGLRKAKKYIQQIISLNPTYCLSTFTTWPSAMPSKWCCGHIITFKTWNTSQPTTPTYTFQPKPVRSSNLLLEFLLCDSPASYFSAPSVHRFLQNFLMTKLQTGHRHSSV